MPRPARLPAIQPARVAAPPRSGSRDVELGVVDANARALQLAEEDVELDPDDEMELDGLMGGARPAQDCDLCLHTSAFASQKAKMCMLVLAVALMAAVAYIASVHAGMTPLPRRAPSPLSDVAPVVELESEADPTLLAALALASSDPAFPGASSGGVAVIGSSGYIGSRLLASLRDAKVARTIGFDRVHEGRAAEDIPDAELRAFDTVVHLGGVSRDGQLLDQADSVVAVAKRMLPTQTLVFASTAALAEGYDRTPMKEADPLTGALASRDPFVAAMMQREQALAALSSSASATSPRIIGLRLGTVVGLSESQRLDAPYINMTCSAFATGRIHLEHPESMRSVLWMEDLLTAVRHIVAPSEAQAQLARFELFHLASFHATHSKQANTLAWKTTAPVVAHHNDPELDQPGWSVDSSKIQQTFGFQVAGTLESVQAQLQADVPRMCSTQQAARASSDSVPCVVCGHSHMVDVLDLHSQPLANDFRATAADAQKCERFPLKLVRCPRCYHSQLSHLVDRGFLFSHYLYASGTSASLQVHFAWLAEKIIAESLHAAAGSAGTILEIASNDGSQLDQFKKRGWNTVGVDPAANIAEVAKAKGHTIHVGFWSVDSFALPPPDQLDAIVAQNVFAHVFSPTEFLHAAARAMGPHTKLYLQTSQCEMYESGQYDTVYHEHVSFFTAHSFRYAAALAGLKVIAFEIVPIHGNSCLVTMQKPGPGQQAHASLVLNNKGAKVPSTAQTTALTQPTSAFSTSADRLARDPAADHLPEDRDEALALESPTFQAILRKERDMGLTTDWFYVKYEAQARDMRDWLVRHLVRAQSEGHALVGYAAAAKGMVLLHYILETQAPWKLDYVVDDAKLKQNTFCPGTDIPVKPTAALAEHDKSKPLTVLVFAWNFWEEIARRIVAEVAKAGMTEVFVLVPWPRQIWARMDLAGVIHVLEENPFRTLRWPDPLPAEPRTPTQLISHLRNEEYLLPWYIRQHAPHFDTAVLLDYASTDSSRAIWEREAPSSWEWRKSRNEWFAGGAVDDEVMDVEREKPGVWHIALNTPEMLFHPDLRAFAAAKERQAKEHPESLRTDSDVPANPDLTSTGMRFTCWLVMGNDSTPLLRHVNLAVQRHLVLLGNTPDKALHPEWSVGRMANSRIMHRDESRYSLGRHSMAGPWMWSDQGFILKFLGSPWPGIRERKLHVKDTIPESDKRAGIGGQHQMSPEVMDQWHADWLQAMLVDLPDIRDDAQWAHVDSLRISRKEMRELQAMHGV